MNLSSFIRKISMLFVFVLVAILTMNPAQALIEFENIDTEFGNNGSIDIKNQFNAANNMNVLESYSFLDGFLIPTMKVEGEYPYTLPFNGYEVKQPLYTLELMKVDAQGNLDTTFGTNGYFSVNGIQGFSYVMEATDQGILLLVNYSKQKTNGVRSEIIKLNENGKLDNAFGIGGRYQFISDKPEFEVRSDFVLQGGMIYVQTNYIELDCLDGTYACNIDQFYHLHKISSQTGVLLKKVNSELIEGNEFSQRIVGISGNSLMLSTTKAIKSGDDSQPYFSIDLIAHFDTNLERDSAFGLYSEPILDLNHSNYPNYSSLRYLRLENLEIIGDKMYVYYQWNGNLVGFPSSNSKVYIIRSFIRENNTWRSVEFAAFENSFADGIMEVDEVVNSTSIKVTLTEWMTTQKRTNKFLIELNNTFKQENSLQKLDLEKIELLHPNSNIIVEEVVNNVYLKAVKIELDGSPLYRIIKYSKYPFGVLGSFESSGNNVFPRAIFLKKNQIDSKTVTISTITENSGIKINSILSNTAGFSIADSSTCKAGYTLAELNPQYNSCNVDIIVTGAPAGKSDVEILIYYNNMINPRKYIIENVTVLEDDDQIVYRFYNQTQRVHFYTADENEVALVKQNDQYMYEGRAFVTKIFSNQSCLSGQPVYRAYNPVSRVHVYTIDVIELESIKLNPSWIYEGVVYCAFESPRENLNPLFRFWSSVRVAHFYTSTESEKNYVLNNLKDFVAENVAYYVKAI